MVSAPYYSFNASDRSYFALMKKEIHAIALKNGFTDRKIAEIDIIVAEMASNLLKHAGGGEILVKMTDYDGEALEIVCIDSGRGMQDPGRMLADGFSSSNTLGHGLGSIKRLSDTFEVYSLKDWGTILLSRVYKKSKSDKKAAVEIRSLLVCKPGEEVCGDGCAVKVNKEKVSLMLGDGLGHGPEAHLAAERAATCFNASDENDPVEMIRLISKGVKHTRGLVAAVAVLDIENKKWKLCGVGNINTRVFHIMASKTHIAYNGIVGLSVPNTMKAQEIPNEKGQVIIMTSDGIKTKWEPGRYTGIMKYDLSILAAAIYKDHARRTDDMSVLLCKVK